MTWAYAGELAKSSGGGSDGGQSSNSGYAFGRSPKPFELTMPTSRERKGDSEISSQNYNKNLQTNSNISKSNHLQASKIDSWASKVAPNSPSIEDAALQNFLDQAGMGKSGGGGGSETRAGISELPNTSSWGALITAHVAHLNDTLPYAVVEKDRLERILAASSSSGSSFGGGSGGTSQGGSRQPLSTSNLEGNQLEGKSSANGGIEMIRQSSQTSSGASKKDASTTPSVLTSKPLAEGNVLESKSSIIKAPTTSSSITLKKSQSNAGTEKG